MASMDDRMTAIEAAMNGAQLDIATMASKQQQMGAEIIQKVGETAQPFVDQIQLDNAQLKVQFYMILNDVKSKHEQVSVWAAAVESELHKTANLRVELEEYLKKDRLSREDDLKKLTAEVQHIPALGHQIGQIGQQIVQIQQNVLKMDQESKKALDWLKNKVRVKESVGLAEE